MRWGRDGSPEVADLCVRADASLLDAMKVIDAGAQSIAFVCDEGNHVIGSLTDGDVRRALIAGASLDGRCLPRIMRKDFAFVRPDTGRAEVLDIMRARDIGQLPILDDTGHLCGLHTIAQLLSARERPNCAVILAGGQGTRLRPLTETVPKPMLKVAGRPILERLVLHLMGCGIRRFYISVNYRAEVIVEHFGDGARFGCQIEYLRETRPLGTGGPLSLLSPEPDAPVVVINGDLVTECDVGQMLDFHEAGSYTATFGVKPYNVQIPFGVITVDGDQVVEVREKPTQRLLINAGVYVISPEGLRRIPKDTEFPITHLFEGCIRDGLRVGAYDVREDWIDVGEPDQLKQARGE